MKQLSYIKSFNQQLLIKVCLLFYLFLAGFNGIGQVYYNNINSLIKQLSFINEPPNSKLSESFSYLNSSAPNFIDNEFYIRAGGELTDNISSELKLFLNQTFIGSISLDSSYFAGSFSRNSMPIFYDGDSTVYIFSSEKILSKYNPKIQTQNHNFPIYLYNKNNPSYYDQFALYKIIIDIENKKITSISKNKITSNLDLSYSVYFNNNKFFFVCNEFNKIKLFTINLSGELINSDSLLLFEKFSNFKINYSLKQDYEFSNDGNYMLFTYEIDTINLSKEIKKGLKIFNIKNNQFSSIEKILEIENNNDLNNLKVLPPFFSLNNKYIYVPLTNHLDNSIEISQYSISETPIANSKIIIYKNQNIFPSFKSHVYGTNGKIYLGPNVFGNFSIFKYPNRKGLECGFQELTNINSCELPIPNYPNIKNCFFPYQPHQYHGHNLDFQIKLECDSGFTTINLSDSINLNDFKWFIFDNQGGNIYSDSASGRNIHLKTPYPGKFFLKFRCKAPNGFVIWYSDTIDIDYSKVPQPSASFVIHDQKACQFVDFKIFNTGFYPDPDSTSKWTWTFNNWDTSLNSFQDTFHFKFTDTGLFSVNLNYSNNYCSRSFQSNKKIEVLSAPKPAILASSDSICNSSFLKFQNKYTSSILKYTVWYNGFGDSLVQNQAVLDSFFYPLAGKFFLKQHLYSDNGCISIDSIPITVIKGFEPNQKSRLISSSFDDYQLKITWDSIPFANAYQLWNGSQPQVLNKLIYSGNSFNHSFDFFEPFPIQYFRLKVMDACKNELASNPSNSLALKHNFSDLGLIISWNSYDSFFNNLKYYQLLSSIDGINFQNIQQTQNLEYLDLSFFQKNNDSIAYKIIAHGNDSLEIAHSPILWVRSPFSIFIANAFSPNQDLHNPHFMPISTGVLSQNYQLRIYNRWGEEIFVSNNKNQAWDGKNLKNQPAPEGVYFYTLQFSYLDPQNIIRRSLLKGQVTLIR